MINPAQPKVLLVVPRLNQGGAETYTYQLALGLTRYGVPVSVASGGGRLATKLVRQGIRHVTVPIRQSTYLSAVVLRTLIQREQYALVHANAIAAGLAVARACDGTQIPWLMTAHGVIEDYPYHYQLHQAKAVICVSYFLRQWLQTHSCLQTVPLVTIHNGVEISSPPLPIRRLCSTQQHPNDRPFVIGIAARLSAKIVRQNSKGHYDLLHILANYPPARSWHLLVAGKGNGALALKVKANRLGLNRRVTFLGLVTDMPNFYANLDVFALPTREETFGLVIAEAMAAKKPVVGYRVGGVPEVIEDDVTGYLSPVDDTEHFAHQLKRLAQDQALREAQGQAGLLRIIRHFDSATMVIQTLNLYYSILRSHQ